MRLQQEFDKQKGNLPQLLDYKWIKPELTYPSYDHLTFGYKNQVFSVILDLTLEGDSPLPNEIIERFLAKTAEHNLVPCLFPVDIPTLEPQGEGWNLFHPGTGKPIIPSEIATDKSVPMSEWELRNFAIQVVRHQIEESLQGKILSFCDVLEVNPQLWFESADGRRCWTVVRHLRKPEEEEGFDLSGLVAENPILQDYDGYFGGVYVVSQNPFLRDERGELVPLSERFDGDAPLYRGDQFSVKFKGIQPVNTV